MGEVQDQHFGAWPVPLIGLLHVVEKFVRRAKREVEDVTVGKDRRVEVDRIGRGRHHHDVPRIDRRPHEMGETLLDPNRGDDFVLVVQFNAKTSLVVMGDSQAQLGNTTGGRVAVIARVLGRLTKLINNRLRWRIIWIAHAKIDDILTGSPRLHLQFIDDGKHVGW